MKRILCVLLALTACVSLSAQQQGDKSVSFYAGFNFSTIPSASLNLQAEFGYFVVDNLRTSFAVGLPFSSTVLSKVGTENLKQNNIGVYFNPNVAYYFKLADNIYYTPELGVGFELGSFKYKTPSTVLVNGKYNGFYTYLYPIYFEIRVNARMAIGLALGELYYENFKYRDGADVIDRSNYFSFSLNSGSLCWRYYL